MAYVVSFSIIKYENRDLIEGMISMNDEYKEIMEDVKSEMCDHYCKFRSTENQEELDEICKNCPLDRLN